MSNFTQVYLISGGRDDGYGEENARPINNSEQAHKGK